MTIKKFSKGKPKGDGTFLLLHNDDQLEIVFIEDDWVFDYPNRKTSMPLEEEIKGWVKIEV